MAIRLSIPQRPPDFYFQLLGRVRAYCGAVTDSPALADTLATFTAGGLIQNLKRYLTEPNLDPDALTAEMTTVFEHLWNSFTPKAKGATP